MGEWVLPDNFLIRGTRFNRGVLLKFMIDAGADSIGDPSQSHCVAIDARARRSMTAGFARGWTASRSA